MLHLLVLLIVGAYYQYMAHRDHFDLYFYQLLREFCQQIRAQVQVLIRPEGGLHRLFLRGSMLGHPDLRVILASFYENSKEQVPPVQDLFLLGQCCFEQ
jgi:hypothetical protein